MQLDASLRCATASSPACRWAWRWWKASNTAARSSLRAWPWNSAEKSSACPGTSPSPGVSRKQGAKLITCAAEVIEELPTPLRAALLQAQQPEAEQRNLLAAVALNRPQKKLYDLLSTDQPVHIDDLMERSGLNSSEVLATLFDLEMKAVIRQLPDKQFQQSLAVEADRGLHRRPQGRHPMGQTHPQGQSLHQ